ncbi:MULTISPECIES: multidrug effflux MFS transporter [unclassified Herbaspirillum]|uniref:multidrug effflux MFS transporter n=1 Tax=unclassified Herbaspirillum TaxID=2624150 RepID=UPI001151D99F|nr:MULTISPECIES: multidrug effflux MFS transporter [unclassified Herbaspirillum]MBB5392266.1 DHA1 family bicyclomycin/chloramphenicol resistance-like MFS transporter [Herbaspirillum sp. SJZ102]TQK05908.1 DHA1 family bicyclomycin/chloramphenicol resistance-like MFS transporter [Herbaspirillum sp. SJZ130]TQK12614.1 DHA1 family bicyclomycin/chloramphenicol resistance-like MFS transporter [Herbaspirillum sp. SJZ106]
MPRLPFILTVAMLSAFGLIASDVYLPAMPSMTTEFGVADWQMPQTISFYLLALAMAQLAYGPLSDRNGRKPVLLAGIILYIIGSVGCATSATYNGLLAWRMLEAVSAAAGLVVGRALIADTCDKRTSAKVYAVIYPLVSLSPALAPAIGGHLAAAFGWRADFLFVAAFGVVALLMAIMLLPETLPRHARTQTSPFNGFSHVLRDRTFRRYTLVVCAIYCAWFVYLTQSPFLFARQGLSEEQSGWLYLPLTAGIIGANLLTKRLLDRWPYDRILAAGVMCFMLGGVAFLAVFALGLHGAAAVVLPMCLVSLANGSSLSLAVSGAIASEHGHAATASGLVGFCQIGSAALAAMGISAAFGTGLGVLGGAVLVLGLIALSTCLPRPGRRMGEA